jgi:hypothetical protein
LQRTLRAEHAPDTDAYAAKYAELKEANVKEVDRYLTAWAYTRPLFSST